jgi:hypothetical protein
MNVLRGVDEEEVRLLGLLTFHYEMAVLSSATYTVGPPHHMALHLKESIFDVGEMHKYVTKLHEHKGITMVNHQGFKHEGFFCRLLGDLPGYSKAKEADIYSKLNGDWYEDEFENDLSGAKGLMCTHFEHFATQHERLRIKHGTNTGTITRDHHQGPSHHSP